MSLRTKLGVRKSRGSPIGAIDLIARCSGDLTGGVEIELNDIGLCVQSLLMQLGYFVSDRFQQSIC